MIRGLISTALQLKVQQHSKLGWSDPISSSMDVFLRRCVWDMPTTLEPNNHLQHLSSIWGTCFANSRSCTRDSNQGREFQVDEMKSSLTAGSSLLLAQQLQPVWMHPTDGFSFLWRPWIETAQHWEPPHPSIPEETPQQWRAPASALRECPEARVMGKHTCSFFVGRLRPMSCDACGSWKRLPELARTLGPIFISQNNLLRNSTRNCLSRKLGEPRDFQCP